MKDNSFQYMRAVFCSVWTARALTASDTREPPERANTWSMSNYPSWQVTLAIINPYWIYILEYRCTDQQDIGLFYFRASSVHACTQTALSALGRGTRALVQADCVNNRPVKQYIVRGPFATASQTTQNNKPQSYQNDALHCAEREDLSAYLCCFSC